MGTGAEVAVIGVGRLGEALVRGLLRAGVPAAAIGGSSGSAEAAALLTERLGVAVGTDPAEAVQDAATVLVAVPPAGVAGVLGRIAGVLRPGAAIVSLAAGVRLETLVAALPGETTAIRAMTNLPVAYGAGMTVLSAPAGAASEARERAESLFRAVGAVAWVAEEQQAAATAVAGSGPAYLYYLAGTLVDAAVGEGLDRDTARLLVTRTLAGAGILLREEDAAPDELLAEVATPGGTTAAALDRLDRGQVARAVRQAVRAAAERADPTAARLPEILRTRAALAVTRLQFASGGVWEEPFVVRPHTASVRELDEWLDAADEDVAVEVFCTDEVFLGARVADPVFLRAVLEAVRRGTWSTLADAPAHWRLPDGTPLLPGDRPEKLEVGVVNAWRSVGPSLLWRRGEPAPNFARLGEALRLAAYATPVALEAAWTVPATAGTVPAWIGVNVSEPLYRLDEGRLASLAESFLHRTG
ncbi:hypothetical protein GCM10022221_32400 [Actinocorallia aurea]